jgi:hypothetical protein
MDAGRNLRLLAVGIDTRVYSDSPLFRKWEAVEFARSLFRGGVPQMFFYKPFMGVLDFDSRCEIALADGVLLREGPFYLDIVTEHESDNTGLPTRHVAARDDVLHRVSNWILGCEISCLDPLSAIVHHPSSPCTSSFHHLFSSLLPFPHFLSP